MSVNGPRERFILSIENQEHFGKLDEKMKRELKRLSVAEKIGVAEIVDGAVNNHNIYASKRKDSEAAFEDMTNIPYFYGAPRNLDVFVNAAMHSRKEKYEFTFSYTTSSPRGQWGLKWRVSKVEKKMVELIKTTTKNIGEIVDTIAADTGEAKNIVLKKCKDFYNDAKKADLILLKSRNINSFPKTNNLTLFALGAKYEMPNLVYQ